MNQSKACLVRWK